MTMQKIMQGKATKQSAKTKLLLVMAGILLAATMWYCLRMVTANKETSRGTLVERCIYMEDREEAAA